MIQAAIFDMDGLLLQSEPLWTQAEIEVFETVDIHLDEELCRETLGMGLFEVVEFRFAQKPWKNRTLQDVSGQIHTRVVQLIADEGQAMPGARQAIELARKNGARIGLASASDLNLIDTALRVIGLSDAFDHIQSADDLPFCKPHPMVYLEAAQSLGVAPLHCLALEDSITGLIAAKAARMKAVAVPDPALFHKPQFGIANAKLNSLLDLTQNRWDELAALPAR